MCHRPSSSRTRGPDHEVARRPDLHRGAPPPGPWDLSPSGQNGCFRRRPRPPPAIPAAESALGLRPRSALSSAQVLPEWKTSTPPCNTFPSNGDYPLNSLSHARGSLHRACSPKDPSSAAAIRGNQQYRASIRTPNRVLTVWCGLRALLRPRSGRSTTSFRRSDVTGTPARHIRAGGLSVRQTQS